MEFKDVVSTVIATISVIISLFALSKSSKASSAALNIQHASVELEIRNAIENSKNQIQDLSITFAPLKVKVNRTQEEEALFEFHEKALKSGIESLLNQYDDACAKYIDGKIDKHRFKKTYNKEIRNIVENKEFEEYFNPTTSNYKPILIVYKEWFDLEV
ncbi:hypothetical protein CBW54_09730 [Yersinia kristensenii]|nr:hypothetical protein CBW54_09730 [Yersinia kristensenii]